MRDATTYAEGSDREQVSVLGGGNAAGYMLRPLVLFSGVCHLASCIVGTENRCYVGVNSSGIMDYNVWKEYFSKDVLPALTAWNVRSYLLIVDLMCAQRQLFFQNVVFLWPLLA